MEIKKYTLDEVKAMNCFDKDQMSIMEMLFEEDGFIIGDYVEACLREAPGYQEAAMFANAD